MKSQAALKLTGRTSSELVAEMAVGTACKVDRQHADGLDTGLFLEQTSYRHLYFRRRNEVKQLVIESINSTLSTKIMRSSDLGESLARVVPKIAGTKAIEKLYYHSTVVFPRPSYRWHSL